MESQNIRIRLRAYDSKLLDTSTSDIINTANRTGAKVKGPIPLPTRIKKYDKCRNWSPQGLPKSTIAHKIAKSREKKHRAKTRLATNFPTRN